jgi:hypothetical protein
MTMSQLSIENLIRRYTRSTIVDVAFVNACLLTVAAVMVLFP